MEVYEHTNDISVPGTTPVDIINYSGQNANMVHILYVMTYICSILIPMLTFPQIKLTAVFGPFIEVQCPEFLVYIFAPNDLSPFDKAKQRPNINLCLNTTDVLLSDSSLYIYLSII